MTNRGPDPSASGTDRRTRPAEPLYRRIAEEVRAAIEAGEYADARGLPSEHELCTMYGVSRGTVRQAFAYLRSTGVVSSRQGARSQAHSRQRAQSMANLLSFSRWAHSIGQTPSGWTVTSMSVLAGDEAAAELDVPVGSDVVHVERVRLLDDVPVMLESTYYPQRLAVLLKQIDLDTESITSRLEGWGVVLADAEHRIDAVAATSREAELLGVAAGAPLLRTKRRTRDLHGQVCEYSIDLYRGSDVAFVVQNSAAASSTARVTSLERP